MLQNTPITRSQPSQMASLSTHEVLLPLPNPAANGARVATLMRQLQEAATLSQ